MGISSGGLTLLHMATQQPSRIDAMVLIGATTYFPEQARKIFRAGTAESITPEEYQAQRGRHVRGDEQFRALRKQFNTFKDSYDDMNFTSPYLSTITARTLIIHGDRDEFFPIEIPMANVYVDPEVVPVDCAQRRSCAVHRRSRRRIRDPSDSILGRSVEPIMLRCETLSVAGRERGRRFSVHHVTSQWRADVRLADGQFVAAYLVAGWPCAAPRMDVAWAGGGESWERTLA